MKQILAFGASSNSKSINKQVASHVAGLVTGANVTLLDLNDFEMPIYSIDREQETGIPQLALDFKKHISAVDGFVISFAEHNGTYTAAFKNILDWISRTEGDLWENKPMLLLSTSPGGNGGATGLAAAVAAFGYLKGKVVGSLAIPFFNKNFDGEKGIVDEELREKVSKLVEEFVGVL